MNKIPLFQDSKLTLPQLTKDNLKSYECREILVIDKFGNYYICQVNSFGYTDSDLNNYVFNWTDEVYYVLPLKVKKA